MKPPTPDLLFLSERDEYRKRFCLRSMWSGSMLIEMGVLDCRSQDTRDKDGRIADGFRQVDRCAVCYAMDEMDRVLTGEKPCAERAVGPCAL